MHKLRFIRTYLDCIPYPELFYHQEISNLPITKKIYIEFNLMNNRIRLNKFDIFYSICIQYRFNPNGEKYSISFEFNACS